MIRLVEDRIFIDDFIDVVSISEQCVNFIFEGYTLDVNGKGLRIAGFSRNEIIIHGQLLSIHFNYAK